MVYLRAKTARFINPCLFVFPIGTSLSNKYDFNFSTPQLLKLSSSFSASSRSSDAILEMMPPFRPIVLCEIDLFNMVVNIRKTGYGNSRFKLVQIQSTDIVFYFLIFSAITSPGTVSKIHDNSEFKANQLFRIIANSWARTCCNARNQRKRDASVKHTLGCLWYVLQKIRRH